MELQKSRIKMEYESEIFKTEQDSGNPIIDELLQTKEMLNNITSLDVQERIRALSSFSSKTLRTEVHSVLLSTRNSPSNQAKARSAQMAISSASKKILK